MLKAEVTKSMIYVVLAVLMGLLAIVLAFSIVNPADSAEFAALKKANSIAFYTDSLSTTESGVAALELGEKFDVTIERVDRNFFVTTLQKALFFMDFKADGYYVVVKPVVGGKPGKGSAAFVFTYPLEGESLKKGLGAPERICVSKAADKRLAEVSTC